MENRMKKILTLLTVTIMTAVTLCSCFSQETPPADTSDSTSTEVVESVLIEKTDSKITCPTAAEFTLNSITDGYANATVKVTMPKKYNADSIMIFWADENGLPLTDYTALAPFKITGTETVFSYDNSTVIPADASRVLVYSAIYDNNSLSEKCISVELPKERTSLDFGTPLYELQVASDIHLQAMNASTEKEGLELPDVNHNQNFVTLLENIKSMSPSSMGLFINGDIAHNGLDSEYRAMYEMLDEHAPELDIYVSIGNHDFYDSREEQDYTAAVKRFLSYATLPNGEQAEAVSYDFWINGYHFVMLGTDIFPKDNTDAYLNGETLEWLDNALSIKRDTSKPTFIFLHQGIYDTVAGTLPDEAWDGIINADEFKEVIQKYPEAILFSGHSHWPMNSKSNIRYRSEQLPTIINTSAVAYLCDNYNGNPAIDVEGSQCYFLYIYEDKLVIRGWDIAAQKWVASAQYVLDYSQKATNAVAEDGYGAEMLGVQCSSTSMRLLSGIDRLDYSEVGFKVTLDYTKNTSTLHAEYRLSSATAYTSVIGNGKTLTAESFGKKYICAVELPAIDRTVGDITVKITPYVADSNGRSYYSETVELTYNAGTIVYK